MGENSTIQWTDHTFNPWIGCTKVHEGCANCYAERDMDKHWQKAKWGPHQPRVVTSDANWAKPLKWNEAAAKEGIRKRVFCASLADVFEDSDVPLVYGVTLEDGVKISPAAWYGPKKVNGALRNEVLGAGQMLLGVGLADQYRLATLADLRERLFRLIDATPWLDWLLLTKRPENIEKMWCSSVNTDGRPPSMLPRKNVWLGTSVSLQEHIDKQLPHLCRCRHLSPVLFVSAEPMLGLLRFQHDRLIDGVIRNWLGDRGINWVIDGGESGSYARPYVLEYSLDIQAQCKAAGVAYFRKQLGAGPVTTNVNLWDFFPEQLGAWGDYAASASIGLRDRSGGDWNEWPEQLRVREFPKVEAFA